MKRLLYFVGGIMLLLGLVSPNPSGARPSPDTLSAAPRNPDFEDVAPQMNAEVVGYGTAAAWGDYDNDGDLDLYVVNLGEANVLLRNDGATFTDVTAEAGVGDSGPGVAGVWADFNNDGQLDMFVSNRPGNNALYLNQGDGTFQNVGVDAGVADPAGYGEGSAWADDDRDGLVDLYVANYSSVNNQPNRLFRNLDGFHFEDIAAQRQVNHSGNGEGIAWADFDNDGDMDLYVANAGGSNVLFQRQNDGTFDDVTVQMHVPGGPGSSYGCAWGDYDNDGWLDLYVAQQGTNKLYHNLGGSDFADVTDQAGVGGDRVSLGCAWGDYDNDGDLDLHVANSKFGPSPDDVLYRNEGGTPITFSDVTAAEGVVNTLDARGNAWGDFDNDGDLDLYVVNMGQGEPSQPNRLFRNNGTPNHWLHVYLIGCVSNRSAIGARVTVTSDIGQIREINGGSGFASQDSLPAEFGLGSWSAPVSVTVSWPSGLQSSLSGVTVDQMISITEPCLDLSLASKAVSTPTASPGDVLTYTIVVPNLGDTAAPAQVTDTLPLSVTWADQLTATSGTPNWDPVEGNVLWAGLISPTMAVTISYQVTVNAGLSAGSIITNVATVDDGYRPPFDTPPVTVTIVVTCEPPSGAVLGYEPPIPIAGQVVTFTAAASGTEPLSFTWAFGDGATSQGATVTHVFTPAGSYTATLTATNGCGEDTTSDTVTVVEACHPVSHTAFTWTPLTPTVGETVTFTGMTSGTAPFTLTWAFGDGGIGQGAMVTHVYTLPGTYIAVFTAANACGQETVSGTLAVVFCQEPAGLDVAYTPFPAIAGQPATFTATLEAGSEPLSYSWRFGDATPPQHGVVVQHTYADPGSYTLTLTVSNNCGLLQGIFPVEVVAPEPTFRVYLPVILRGYAAETAATVPPEHHPSHVLVIE